MKVLIDTNVLSEVRRPQPSSKVMQWLGRLDKSSSFISVVTFAEIRRGIEQMSAGRRKTELSAWLNDDLTKEFGNRLLSVDLAIALAWGDLMSECYRNGIVVAPFDGVIAATARVHGLSVATRNKKDFQNLGLDLVDPWET